ncbi:MAG TPA: hypothetical protein VH120_03385 [Gemmataceae bacterium]|jgi:hypothetical protein|nr:hypothetical protein [Gemmataceae bacterium]
MLWLTLIGLLGEPGVDVSQNVNPPIVGRPADFSGAIGGPFVVQWLVSSNELTAEEPLTLTLRITGPGNLAEMPRPAIGKLPSFSPFAVEDQGDRFLPGDPPPREFRYRVRPRTTAVTEIPRFKFIYFNPRIKPPSRGYQTTYADAVPLTVKSRLLAPAEVPAWMLEPPATDELFGPPPQPWAEWVDLVLDTIGVETERRTGHAVWPVVAAALLIPPLACLGWLILWRRLRPDAARLAAGRRTRAAAIALRALSHSNDRADAVAAAVLDYLRDRRNLPPTARTPAEIAVTLAVDGRQLPAAAATVSVLQRCDAARFGPQPGTDTALADDAARLILDWEAAA